ncbi:MAG: MFS transporter [Ilumatobacteraceae bacterium]|nr:MFS transporter [Ilumatobacteraceae bacterium]
MSLLPSSATLDSRLLLTTRGIRAFVDGTVYVILPAFLLHLGFSGLQIGSVIASSLLGSAVLTLSVGFWAHRLSPARLLILSTLVMISTGIAFGLSSPFLLLLVIAAIGTMNPSAGDVSPFLPLEQSLLSTTIKDQDRTAMFAAYNLVGSLVGAAGALCAGVPIWIALRAHHSTQFGYRTSFIAYGISGFALLVLYSRLSLASRQTTTKKDRALSPASRHIVLKLAALFSLDSFGGGFATQAIFALWVYQRFNLSSSTLGVIFFATGTLSAISSLLAVRISQRIGLVRTMVFTHTPSSILLIGVAFMPTVRWAMALFILRGLLSQMDVPVRTSYVMAVVEPTERAAAASITNVPRSLAAALPPIAAGWMLDKSNFAWPFLICAGCKIVYDFLLLWQFRNIRPPEEQ